MGKKLKLFVWEDFCYDYSGGLAFAIALDVMEAQKMIEDDLGYTVSDWGKLSIYPVNEKVCKSVIGGQ